MDWIKVVLIAAAVSASKELIHGVFQRFFRGEPRNGRRLAYMEWRGYVDGTLDRISRELGEIKARVFDE